MGNGCAERQTTRVALFFVSLGGALALMAGCSEYRLQRVSSAPISLANIPPEQSAVCVLRPHGLGTSVIAPVSDNGIVVGATEGSSYFCYLAEPGVHQIRAADSRPLRLTMEGGKAYYLAHDLHVAEDTLIRITKESALEVSAWCKELDLGAAPKTVAVLHRGEIARAEPAGLHTNVRVAKAHDTGSK